MDWIKAKYDRVLLGLFALIALLVGGLLLMKTLGWKSQFPKAQAAAAERNDFGTDNAGHKIADALARLKEPATIKVPVFNGVPISLFTSAPVMKKVGEPDPIQVYRDDKLIRPPVSNKWLYDNGLELRRVDIIDVDTDGDHFTNREEFEAKPQTNPRDAKSRPPVYAKIQYKECVKTPLSVKFNTFVNDKELTFRLTGATPETAWNTKLGELVAGGEFAAEKNGTEKRFKLDKVDASAGEGKEIAELTDLKSGEHFKVKIKETADRPALSAKLSCALGKEEEKVVTKGEEFSFEVDADQKYTVKNITETEVTLEFTLTGTTEKKSIVIKIPNP